MSSEPEKWIGFRQGADGEAVAMFAMPSGRVREVKVTRANLMQAITEAARALMFSEPKQ